MGYRLQCLIKYNNLVEWEGWSIGKWYGVWFPLTPKMKGGKEGIIILAAGWDIVGTSITVPNCVAPVI